MTKIGYDVILVLDAGKLLPPVQKLQDELNADLALFGTDRKVAISSRMRLWILTVDREMSEKEIKDMKTIIHGQVLTSKLSFANAIEDVELVRSQSGNVSQSAS